MKNLLFTYIVYKLTEWYNQNQDNEINNDLSLLKVMKLLFLVVTASIEIDNSENKDNNLLINSRYDESVFNNFHALPLGHVESDIYENFKKHQLDDLLNIDFETSSINIAFEELRKRINNDNIINLVDESVTYLQAKNNNLVKESHLKLIDISHKHISWDYFYKLAKQINKNSYPIPKETIINEYKYFS